MAPKKPAPGKPVKPSAKAPMKKFAKGGSVRGMGAAKKGGKFSGCH